MERLGGGQSCAVDRRRATANTSQRHRTGDCRNRRRCLAARRGLVEGAAGAGRRASADRRGELRQRLLRRHPRHRRQPVGSGAPGRFATGDAGFGEVAVFLFFGLVAVLGTQYTQALRVDWVGLALAVTTGALSSAVLVANNLRDIPSDGESGKITLAVRLGDKRTRILYQALLAVAAVLTLALTAATPWCAAGLVATPLAVRAAAPVRTGRAGPELIPVLRDTGLTMLVWSIAVAAALTLTA